MVYLYFDQLPVEINLMIKKYLDDDFKKRVGRLEKVFPKLIWEDLGYCFMPKTWWISQWNTSLCLWEDVYKFRYKGGRMQSQLTIELALENIQ